MVLEACCSPVLYYVGIESNREKMRNFLRERAGMTTNLVNKMNCLNSKVGPQEVQGIELEEVQDVGQDEVLEEGHEEVQEVEDEGEMLDVGQKEYLENGQMFRRTNLAKKMTCLKSRVGSEEDPKMGPRFST